MIEIFIFGIVVLNILFRGYNVFIFVQTFQRTSSEFLFNFRLSNRKSQSQQKLAKKITHFIFVQTFQWISSEFLFNFRLSSRKSQSQQKLAKKITYFTIKICSQNLTHFRNLSSLDIEKYYVPAWNVSAWCQRKHLLCTIFWQPRTAFLNYFESKCLIFLCISARKFLFQRRSNFLSDGGELGKG